MMKFVVLALLFIGCVAAATNSSSSSTGESSTGVSSESSSSHAFNTSSSTGEASSTGLSSSSSEHNATFSSSSSQHNDSSSSTGQASSSTGVWSSSTGAIPTPTPTPSPVSCFSSSNYGNTSRTVGNFSDPTIAYTLINNNTYIAAHGWITSISVVYHGSTLSQVVLKRVVANPNNTYINGQWVHYTDIDQVNVTGLVNSTQVQTVNLTQPLFVKKGDFLGVYAANGTFGLNGLTEGYAWCGGDFQNETWCGWNTEAQVRLGFTLTVEVPCDSSSSSTGAAPNTTSSSTGAASSSSISSSSGNPSNSSSTGATPTTHAPTLPPTSSSSTGAAPTEAPHPEPQEVSTSKSVTAVGFVVGAASMLGAVLLVFGVCWYMKRNQNASTMNSPLLSHA